MLRTAFTSLVILSLGSIACGPDLIEEPLEFTQAVKSGPGSKGSTGAETETTSQLSESRKLGGKVKKPIAPLEVVAASLPAYGLRFTDERFVYAEPVWKSSFTVTDTYFVEIATEIPATVTGHHLLTVYMRSPSGNMYQQFEVPFAAGTAALEGEIDAESTGSGYRVWVSLPVKGTFIDSYNLVGAWSVESWMDSEDSAAVSGSFDLR